VRPGRVGVGSLAFRQGFGLGLEVDLGINVRGLHWALAIFRRATGAAQGYGEAAVNGYQQLVIALGEEEQR
jgi:hypothetical protein